MNLLPYVSVQNSKYWISIDFFTKIDGFENPPLKIDGFGRAHRIHANGATDCYILSAEKSHFATHVDITVKMIVEFQNIKAKKVSKMENKT